MSVINILVRINQILNTKTKIQALGIFIISFLGTCFELVGVAIVLPIIELALGNTGIDANVFARTISKLFGVNDKPTVLILLIFSTIAIYIFKALYMVMQSAAQQWFSMKVKRDLAIKLLDSYLSSPYEFFLNTNSAELLRTITQDTEQFYQVINNLLMIISNAITATAIGIYLFTTNIKIALFIICLLSICMFFIFFILNKKFRKYGEINHKYLAIINKALLQIFNGIKEVKILGNENYFIKIYRESYRKQAKNNIKYQILNCLPKQLIETVCISGVLLYMAYCIMFSGDYIKLFSQIAVFCVGAYKMLPSVNGIVAYTNNMLYYKASVDCIYNDIKRAGEGRGDITAKPVLIGADLILNECIKADNIVFGYRNSTAPVINDISIRIDKGESVGLVGSSGGGKTTLADILIGLLEPGSGSVYIDDVNIDDYKGNLGSLIGYIPQSIYLTDDTIRNNIAFGIEEKEIDDKQVWKAIDDAQLRIFIESLPKGIYTEVGERGTRLSGGQRQRIGIARALYRNPDILVLDEATSALDNETEEEIMKAINGLKGNKTIIMIAHRLSTIKNCDRIYEVKDGKVIPRSYSELI